MVLICVWPALSRRFTHEPAVAPMKPVPRCALKVLMALVKVHLHGIMPVLNETKS